jgi:hypothetical protein
MLIQKGTLSQYVLCVIARLSGTTKNENPPKIKISSQPGLCSQPWRPSQNVASSAVQSGLCCMPNPDDHHRKSHPPKARRLCAHALKISLRAHASVFHHGVTIFVHVLPINQVSQNDNRARVPLALRSVAHHCSDGLHVMLSDLVQVLAVFLSQFVDIAHLAARLGMIQGLE